MYLEKAFDADGMRLGKRLPVAEELGETAMMFLVHWNRRKGDGCCVPVEVIVALPFAVIYKY
jgi:hypothetical protein